MRTRGAAEGAGASMLAILSQDAVVGVFGVVLSGANQHPQHRYGAGERDRASQRKDNHIAPGWADQVIVHREGVTCPWLGWPRPRSPWWASRGCPRPCAPQRWS